MSISVSKECTAHIFRVEDGESILLQNVGTYLQTARRHNAYAHAMNIILSSHAYTKLHGVHNPEIENVNFSETSEPIYQLIRSRNSEVHTMNIIPKGCYSPTRLHGVMFQKPTRWIYAETTETIYLSIYLSMAIQPMWIFFQFLNPSIDGRTPGTGDQPVGRPLSTHRTTQTQNKRTQTSIHRVGFKPTIPAFERAKTVHGLNRAATVTYQTTGNYNPEEHKFSPPQKPKILRMPCWN
jgi:hypothetical protein